MNVDALRPIHQEGRLTNPNCPNAESVQGNWIGKHDARAHHVHLYARVLQELFVKAGTLAPEAVEIDKAENNVRALLKSNIEKKDMVFTGTVTTDGVTAYVHFRKRKSEEELRDIEVERERRKAIAAAKQAVNDGDQEQEQEQKKRKTASEQQTSSLASREEGVPEWIVSTDPGRINIATSVIFQNGKLVRKANGKPLAFKLTAGRYYCESGVNKRTKEENEVRKKCGLERDGRCSIAWGDEWRRCREDPHTCCHDKAV
jgi:hypothetical protein